MTDAPVLDRPVVGRSRPAHAKTPWWKYEKSSKVKTEEVMNFSRQASSFIRAGVPLLDALDVLGEERRGSRIAPVVRNIRERVAAGESFSSAVAAHGKVFPRYYTAMVRSAEYTGRLDEVLDRLAGYLERDIETKRKVKSALTYPSAIAVMGVATVLVLVLYVLPKFKAFFEDLNAELPLPTRILLGFTDFLAAWGFVLVGLLAIGALAAITALRRPGGREKFDAALLKIPALGTVVQFLLVERFCRSLSAMVNSGVALPDAVAVAAETSGNARFRRKLNEARESLMRGGGLVGPLAATGLFPSAVHQMLRVGEATGTIDQQLESAGEFYERELTYRLKRFTDLFEPVVIVIMGVLVGFVAVALVTAMYGIYRQVNV